MNCRFFRRVILEPVIKEEQNLLQYPPASRALSIFFLPNAALCGGVFRYEPAV
jgi:hypothetical protein